MKVPIVASWMINMGGTETFLLNLGSANITC